MRNEEYRLSLRGTKQSLVLGLHNYLSKIEMLFGDSFFQSE